MKIGVFSNAWSARQGGGVAEIAAYANVLREFGSVELNFLARITAEEIKELFAIDLMGVRVSVRSNSTASIARRFPRIHNALSDKAYDLVIRQSTAIPHPTVCARAFLLVNFPFQNRVARRERLYLKTYTNIIANSSFTSGWISKRWGWDAMVVNPPVRQVMPLVKKPIILAIGRFSGGKRSKHQLEMIEAFKRLMSSGISGWELHLCGTEEDSLYLRQVKENAEGLPVYTHVNVPVSQLNTLIGEASIFWHATGVAHREQDNPELMEHFGMSTAEAMSAGCVPVVINKGGQKEVVGPNLSEWTWQQWPECVTKTRRLIQSTALLEQLAGVARQQANLFSFATFQERVRPLASSMLNN